MRVVLDTNVFIIGFIDLAENVPSPETIILRDFFQKEKTVVMSAALEEQILRVVLRVKDKDFAGLVRHMLWSDFRIDFVDTAQQPRIAKTFAAKIPRTDLDIFLAAFIGAADCLVSNDGEFIASAARCQNRFACMNPAEFVKQNVKKM